MLISAAIVPHSPLLMPSIGKEQREKLAKTLQAYAELEQAIYLDKPDTLVVISPHGQIFPDAFSGSMAQAFTGVLKEFGDHGTTLAAKVDFLMLDHIHRVMRNENIPFSLTSQTELDYGYTIPLMLLTSHLQNWKLVPLSISQLPPNKHAEFGRALKEVLHAEGRRVVFLASADLSHHANEQSTHGATPEGQLFDATVREKVQALDLPGLLALNPDICAKAGQCGYNPIVVLLGLLDQMNVKPKELAYEAPFGVGYWTVRFDIA